jgi:hypothetical protein
MKAKFSLEDAEFAALQTPGLSFAGAHQIWQDVSKRLNFQFGTLEDARTGDPREFLAEPIPEQPPSEEVLRLATSASNALADKLCPGRHLAQRAILDPTDRVSPDQKILKALKNSGDPMVMKSLTADERMVFDGCRQIEKAITGPYFGDGPFKAGEYRVFRQERLWLPNSGKPGFLAHWGEPNVVFRFGQKAMVAKYKVLPGDVTGPADDAELLDLAILVAGRYEPLAMVATVVIQPLVTLTPEIKEYALSDLEAAYKAMVARITASNHPNAVRTPGEVQCKSCKAVGVCRENAAWRAAQAPPPQPEIQLTAGKPPQKRKQNEQPKPQLHSQANP